MEREEELRLLSLAKEGDHSAFGQLMGSSQDAVYRLALRMTENEEDALDLSQETFLQAYTELGRFRGECRFSSWICRIAYNKCIDHLRKQKRRPTAPMTQLTPEGEETELEFPDLRYEPQTELEKKELRLALREAVEALPDDQREILELREYGALSYEDIAEALKIPVGTVRSRLARARERAARFLVKRGTFSPQERQNERKGGRK